MPSFPPTNAIAIENEELEYRFGESNAVHILDKDNSSCVWGERIQLPEDTILFGISRKYNAVISTQFEIQSYPFDGQHFHIFFESIQADDLLKLFPSYIYPSHSCVSLEIGTFGYDPEYDFCSIAPVIEFNSFSDPPNQKYSSCTLTIKCVRKWEGITLKLFLPTLLLSMLSLSVFSLDVTDISSRLTLVITLALGILY